MSGIGLLLDLWRRNPNFSTHSLHSHGLFSATIATTAAAASLATGKSLASRFLFGDDGISVCFADAGAEFAGDYIPDLRSIAGDYIPDLRSISGDVLKHDYIKYTTKEYPIELKPLFSAFGLRSFALTSLRSFLMFYLPLLEPQSLIDDEDEEDFLQDAVEEQRRDLVVPLKKSVKQIVRETSVVTTRRVLERLAVHHISQRMAWKLLKDVPKSATRKAARGMPTLVYFYSVSRTTFRGHLLGVAASWLVQVGIEIYRCIRSLTQKKEEDDSIDTTEQIRVLRKKVVGTTVRCGASLAFASIGAGIGATLFRPSTGQWIGCSAGDLAGPIIVGVCLDKYFHADL